MSNGKFFLSSWDFFLNHILDKKKLPSLLIKKAWLFNVHIGLFNIKALNKWFISSDLWQLEYYKIIRNVIIICISIQMPIYFPYLRFAKVLSSLCISFPIPKSFRFFFETWNIYAWTYHSQTDFTLVLTSPSPFRSLLLRDMISLSCAKSCSSKSTLRSLFCTVLNFTY